MKFYAFLRICLCLCFLHTVLFFRTAWCGDWPIYKGNIYFTGNNDALSGGIGAGYHNGFYIYVDYLRHFRGIIPLRGTALYIGAGPGIHHHENDNNKNRDDDDDNSIECRVPVGVEYTFTQIPIGCFLELVPALEIVPDIDFHIRGGIGFRYYF